jgi:ABC-type branched-subunit amino acid transport system substrate-binding protein
MYALRSGRRWGAGLAAVLALAFGVAACGAEDEQTTAGDIKLGAGVTEEPCPGGGNPDRGCIYLGVLSDLTEGPFAPLGVPLTQAQRDFWARVNRAGGIAGRFDVNVTRYTRDNKYNPQEHVAKVRQIEPRVLALGQSLGTPMTLAALPIQEQSDLVAAPATWWSGWATDDRGLVLESGASYCLLAMNGLDWAADEFGKPKKVLTVGYPGDYGGDSEAGARIWGRENRIPVETMNTAPNARAGNQDAVVGRIRRENPDVVVLATGPAEMAEIVGKSVAGGFDGQFVSQFPTYNPAVLKSQAAPAILAKYRAVAPWASFGADTPAHRAMEEAAGRKAPPNDGYTFGWVLSYPLKAVLEKAADNGDLTREGLRKAVEEVTVDYEGALPDRTYSGEPNESIVREAVILKPDRNAPVGASVQEDFFAGPTAKGYEFTKACSGA